MAECLRSLGKEARAKRRLPGRSGVQHWVRSSARRHAVQRVDATRAHGLKPTFQPPSTTATAQAAVAARPASHTRSSTQRARAHSAARGRRWSAEPPHRPHQIRLHWQPAAAKSRLRSRDSRSLRDGHTLAQEPDDDLTLPWTCQLEAAHGSQGTSGRAIRNAWRRSPLSTKAGS